MFASFVEHGWMNNDIAPIIEHHAFQFLVTVWEELQHHFPEEPKGDVHRSHRDDGVAANVLGTGSKLGGGDEHQKAVRSRRYHN